MPQLIQDGTAQKIIRELRRAGDEHGHAASANLRKLVLVRCTSSVSADEETDLGAQCYPGVILSPTADSTDTPEELGNVWLTVLGADGVAVAPQAGTVYAALLTAQVEAAEDDIRPRVFTTPQCCTGTDGGGGGGGGGGGTYEPACDEDTGSPADPTHYVVRYTCAQIAALPDSVCFYYAPAGLMDVCEEPLSSFNLLCGSEAVSFLATATIDSIHMCGCGGEADVPQIACVQLLNGTASYASITSVFIPSEFNGSGYPINYTTPNGKVSVAGRLMFCEGRTPPGWYFGGTINSTDPSGDFDCGCKAKVVACEDVGGVTQEIISGPTLTGAGSPIQTLRITTDCGTLDIKMAGPWPCSPPPPPVTYNCIANLCVPVYDGTGTFASLGACQGSGCNPTTPVTYNCISGRCVDPLDGTGTFSSLGDCVASPCTVAETFLCDTGDCVDPLDGTGTYTGADALAFCVRDCKCCGLYFEGKTPTFVITGSGATNIDGTYPATTGWTWNGTSWFAEAMINPHGTSYALRIYCGLAGGGGAPATVGVISGGGSVEGAEGITGCGPPAVQTVTFVDDFAGTTMVVTT